MWHGLIWGPVLLGAAGWSLACWGLLWLLSGLDASATGAWLGWLEQWQIPLWLADWLPMAAVTELKALLTAWGPWLESLLAQAPALQAWLRPLLWLGWGLGLLALLLVGGLLSLLVRQLPRTVARAAGAPARPAAGA